MTGKRAVEEFRADQAAGEQEEGQAGDAHDRTEFHGAQHGGSDCFHIPAGGVFGDQGEQQHGDGVGQGVREKDHGHCHTGEHAVDAQSGGIVVAVQAQTGRDGYSLDALQDIQHDSVQGQRQRHAQDGEQEKLLMAPKTDKTE